MFSYSEKSQFLPYSNPQYSLLGFRTMPGGNYKWIPGDRYSLEPAPGKGGGRWSDQPTRSVSWEAKVLLWLHEVQGAPLVSWLHMASHSLDRRPAMNTLSHREDRKGGGAGHCKFLHTPGEKGQNEKVGALPSCIKGSRLQDGLCW